MSTKRAQKSYGNEFKAQALKLKQPKGVHIPNKRTVYRVMEEIVLNYKPKHKPNGITKANKEACKSDNLMKCDFTAENCLKNV